MEKKQSFFVEEVLPQVTEMTRPRIEPVSWTTDEDLGQSVEVHFEGAARVPTVKFEVGQLMQWPDIKSDGVMIRGIMLESEMSPIGSVRHAAEPVSVAPKSEMLTPVFAGGGGGVVAAAAPLAMVEAVTSRVSVLPVVGSDLITGLYVAAGVTDQLFLGSDGILDKVGHVAGQSCVCIVPVERLPELHEVCDIMFSWMRPVAVLTSQKSCTGTIPRSIQYPGGDSEVCTGTIPRSIQYPGGDSEVSGSPCLRSQEETTSLVDRKGQYDDDAYWFNENPNRACGTAATGTDATVAQYCSYIRGIVTNNWASQQPASSES